jgi:antitoxin (DNA-binding transcriptional repressor) of toxin-antitoxin stability system
MTLRVSISQFRQNIADYIAKAKEGYTVVLRDEKQGEEVVQLKSVRKFNPQTFSKALEAASGIFTATAHPKWKTKKDITSWLVHDRKSADRKF